LQNLSSKREELKKQSTIPEVKESDYEANYTDSIVELVDNTTTEQRDLDYSGVEKKHPLKERDFSVNTKKNPSQKKNFRPKNEKHNRTYSLEAKKVNDVKYIRATLKAKELKNGIESKSSKKII
jgi:hypothetical protein